MNLRHSAAQGTVSAIGGTFAVVPSSWHITATVELAQTYEAAGVVWQSPARCTELELERYAVGSATPHARYQRAGAGLASVVLDAWETGSWTGLPFTPD